jgi:SAM-dependent methyltransferase
MNTPKAPIEPGKKAVQDFWQQASCGEDLYLPGVDREAYVSHSKARYELEPYIPGLAKFETVSGKRVLEIGVGLGADHQRFAEAGAELFGVDLTPRAVEHTRRRLSLFGLRSTLMTADAEALPFPESSFDVVYSWGVLHHSPDTRRAFSEVLRVLRPGGEARIMIYHTWSMIGFMLWTRYGLLSGKPWRSMSSIYDQHLESPGTKAYTTKGALALLEGFEQARISIELSHGDLLESAAGQRHRGLMLDVARRVWPRTLIRKFLPNAGLFMLITARKPSNSPRQTHQR